MNTQDNTGSVFGNLGSNCPGDDEMVRVLTSRLDTELDAIDPTVAIRLAAARQRVLRSQSPTGRFHLINGWIRLSPQRLRRVAFASVFALLIGVSSLWLDRNAQSPDTEIAIAPPQPKAPTMIADVPSPPDSPSAMTDTPVTPLEDLNVLSAAEDIDFYNSVHFLLWLEKQRG